MLSVPKLVSPRLTRWPRFALDERGLLPSDSCVAVTTPGTREGKRRLRALKQRLEALVGRRLSRRDLLLFTMAFLNSPVSAFLLRVGREPTPKGSWNVNEEYLRLVRLGVSDRATVEKSIEITESCVDAVREGAETAALEEELDKLVMRGLGIARTRAAREIKAWAAAEREDA